MAEQRLESLIRMKEKRDKRKKDNPTFKLHLSLGGDDRKAAYVKQSEKLKVLGLSQTPAPRRAKLLPPLTVPGSNPNLQNT